MPPDLRDRLAQALAGRYRLEQQIGAGGMATVYLAQDVRHDRRVAIKVLRPELSALIGAERFLTEIRTTANLQHPHILALFDSGEVDGTVFYVMPYVEGESLRDRLNREKQLPVPEAVRIAGEVAGALDYAHRHGVIHRDIKPENILLHDGQALVADFGIALAPAVAGDSRMTETGISLGTPTYMSPEQATGGRQVDARTDVYALGCVLYEMLAGEAPFTGPTPQVVVARVMTDEPRPLTDHRRTVPVHVDAVARRALQKLPADRFATAREFAEALQRPDSGAVTSAQVVTTRRAMNRRLMTAAIVLVGIGTATALGWFAGRRAATLTDAVGVSSRLAMLTPALGGSGVGEMNRELTLTSDGSSVMYVIGAPDRSLAVQRLDSEQPSIIPGGDLAYAPSISPDGRWIAVRNQAGDAMLLPAAGTQQTLTPIARGFAFYAWHPDGSLWLTRTPYRTIERVVPGSSTLETVHGGFENGVGLQQIIDGGRSALATQQVSGTSSGPCMLVNLQTWERKTLIASQTVTVRYTSGYLVYAQPDGTLLAARFDPRTGRLDANPTTIASGVSITGSGDAQFDVAPNGTVAYVPEAPRSLVLTDRSGSERLAVDERHNFHIPRFSPDGRRLSIDFVSASGRDVWILDLEQKTLTRTTFDRDGHDASWSPDGRTLTYGSNRGGDYGIYAVHPGTGARGEPLLLSRLLGFTGVWMPDGKRLVTVAADLKDASAQDIAFVNNGGKGPIEPIVATPFRENYPAVSRDGRWLAFVSDQSGRTEVYVRPLEGSAEVQQISQGGGDEPVWGPDSRELFYRSYAGSEPQLALARLETTPALRVLERRNLFSAASYLGTTPHASYDLSPDGRTFVFVRRNAASRIVVIQNLPALVHRAEAR